MTETSGPRVLYIAYWGAAEPLGQSLVVPAIRKLAALGVDLTFVSFEKSSDMERWGEFSRLQAGMQEAGIRWIPLRYHKHPKIPATLWDLLQGCARSLLSQLKSRPAIVHARTFAGGLMGLVLAPLLGARLVYHNEGFYPDEQVDAGVWQAGSRPHRIAKGLEKMLYSAADGIITLSHPAMESVLNLPAVKKKGTPVIVVPSCVDLEHFGLATSNRWSGGEPLKFVYAGSVGGRYKLDTIGRFVAQAVGVFDRVHLRIITRSEPLLVESMLGASGLAPGDWSAVGLPYSAMPDALRAEHVGLHFLPQGLGQHGGSPTKVGEYWASGLPVVITADTGDADGIIRREGVGVVLRDHSSAEYAKAAGELRDLLKDEGLALRCRRAAEEHYGLDPACKRQLELYRLLWQRPTVHRMREGAEPLPSSTPFDMARESHGQDRHRSDEQR